MEVILNGRNVVVLKSGDDWFDFRLGFNAYFVKDVLFQDNIGVNYNKVHADSRLAGYNSTEEQIRCTTHESFLMNLVGKRKKYQFVSKVTAINQNGVYILEGDGGRHLTFKSFHNAVICDYVIKLDMDNQEMDFDKWNSFAQNSKILGQNFSNQLIIK